MVPKHTGNRTSHLYNLNRWYLGAAFIVAAFAALAESYHPPAGDRFAIRGPNGSAILPGGRVIQPYGQQFPTGPGPSEIAVSATGRSIATVNLGPERASVTFLEEDRSGEWTLHNVFAAGILNKQSDFHSLASGLVFANEKQVWVSEGESGRVRLVDASGGARKKVLDLNGPGIDNSFSAALAYDQSRGLLLVLDRAHSRLVLFDSKRGVQVGSVATEFPPHAIGLSADGQRAWVAESSSLCSIDLSKPENPKVQAVLRIGNPSRVLVTEKAVYVSDAHDDTIEVIDPATNTIKATIPIRIPGLESLRGVLPMGMAFEGLSQRLLVAETGLNAVAAIDPARNEVLGHIPVGWFPTAVAARNGQVLVANARGRGTGPSSILVQPDALDFAGVMRRGSVSKFAMPDSFALSKQTGLVFAANGFFPSKDATELKVPVHYVVLIVKGKRTFDDVLGDVKTAGTAVAGLERLAIFGSAGYADGGKGRFSLHNVNVTPNQHALAQQFAFSDNFYVDSEEDESETGTLQRHLERFQIPYRDFSDRSNVNVSDQGRVEEFIGDIKKKYVEGGQPFPRFIAVVLPNDSAADPQPSQGYPYRASYVADNDVALGKAIDFLSHTTWWREMAIFVTESGTEGGRDHIDAHRTLLFGIGPFFKRGYVSQTNASFPSVLKTVFQLLHVPPMNLLDASASDLNDLFAVQADFAPYKSIATDPLLFDSK